jgi:quercetin dioxygenase-like cupin family protein
MESGSVGRGFVINPRDHVPELAPEVKASGSLTVMTLRVEGGPPRHVHTYEDESLFVFTGELAVECGADQFRAEAGAFVFLPRGVPHGFHSVNGPATGLLIATPGGIDEYFAERMTPTRRKRSNRS